MLLLLVHQHATSVRLGVDRCKSLPARSCPGAMHALRATSLRPLITTRRSLSGLAFNVRAQL